MSQMSNSNHMLQGNYPISNVYENSKSIVLRAVSETEGFAIPYDQHILDSLLQAKLIYFSYDSNVKHQTLEVSDRDVLVSIVNTIDIKNKKQSKEEQISMLNSIKHKLLAELESVGKELNKLD